MYQQKQFLSQGGGGVMNIDKTFCGDANNIAYHFTIILKAFSYCNIEANNQYFTIRNGNFSNTASIVLAGNLGVTADTFNHTVWFINQCL